MQRLATKRNILIVSALLMVTTRLGEYCGVYSETCPVSGFFDDIVFSVLEPLFFFSGSIFMVSIFLFFTRDEVFSAWLKFAKRWLPLSILLIVISPTDGSSAFFPALFSKELTSMWMSGIFFIISLIIIIYKFLTLKKSRVARID